MDRAALGYRKLGERKRQLGEGDAESELGLDRLLVDRGDSGAESVGGPQARLSRRPQEGPSAANSHRPERERVRSKLLGWVGSSPPSLPAAVMGLRGRVSCVSSGPSPRLTALWKGSRGGGGGESGAPGPSRKRKKQDVLVSFKVRAVF